MPWMPCCCCRYCPHCADGFAPGQWQVEIEGILPASPPGCQQCEQLNGAYVLEPSGSVPPLGACGWSLTLPEAICGVGTVRLSVWPFVGPDGWSIQLDLLDQAQQMVMSAVRHFAQPPVCLAMTGESLGRLQLGLGYPGLCDVSQSSATVTALRPCKAE